MPYLFAAQTILAILQLLDNIKPSYLAMTHRFWDSTSFELGFDLFWPLILLLALWIYWALTGKKSLIIMLPAVAFLIFPIFGLTSAVTLSSLVAVIVGLVRVRKNGDYLFGMLAIATSMELVAALHWMVFVPLGIENPLMTVVELEWTLFYLTATISPFVILIFILVGFLVPLSRIMKKGRITETERKDVVSLSKKQLIFLGLTICLSLVAAVYPYFPIINPGSKFPGVDIMSYFEEAQLVGGDLNKIIHLNGGSRPFYYLVLFGFQRIIGSDILTAIKFLPIILNPLIVFSTFFLAKEVFGELHIALLAAFFTTAGFQLSIGMYAYFLADILMLSIIFLSLALFFRSNINGSKRDLCTATILGSLFVFTHPWTFDQYYAPIVLAALYVLGATLTQNKTSGYKTNGLIYFSVIGFSDLVKMLVLRGSVEGVAALSIVATNFTKIESLWLDLINSSNFYVGGYLTNLPLLVLATAGIIQARTKNLPNIFLWFFLTLTSIVYLPGNVVIKSRLLYNVPMGILAAYGCLFIQELKIDAKLKKIILVTTSITLLNCLFRNLANLI